MKFIKILSLVLFACISAKAQYPAIPLYGTTANSDTRFSSLNVAQTSIADTLGATPDTLLINPGLMSGGTGGIAFHKTYFMTLKDSCVLAIKTLNQSYTGSTIRIVISNG